MQRIKWIYGSNVVHYTGGLSKRDNEFGYNTLCGKFVGIGLAETARWYFTRTCKTCTRIYSSYEAPL